jgi:hypothetical protein
MRVLPLELLPLKTFGIELIQFTMHKYLFYVMSLRVAVKAVATPAEHSPAHSTLHRWLSGLGEKILDRSTPIYPASQVPTSAVLAQTGRILSQDVTGKFLTINPVISLDKYRSQRRYDQLVAVARLLVLAMLLFSATVESVQLLEWNRLLLSHFYVAVWNFPSTNAGTSMQQAQAP